MTTNQPLARSFRAGDRIIYNGEYIGVLISASGHVNGLHWKVRWEDGAETDNVYPQSDMVFANGGPSSAHRNVIAEAELGVLVEQLRESLKSDGSEAMRDTVQDVADSLARITGRGARGN